MKLIGIQLQGFKSFAPKTSLQFSDGITAVIGPNGSGKSNISDAVRWVLGEQSSKLLRGKERTDVIFSGTDDKGSARRARVTLTFDNESGRFPLEAPQVQISRTLARDGESEYSINGEAVRLLDLQQMLAEAGIGAKSYTVISQGMVDRYLTATPEGRRELFDEATGIRSLQLKVALAEKKLRATQAHAAEIETILTELKPRLTVLRRQVDRHNERQARAAEFAAKQAAFLHRAWHEHARAVEQIEAHLTVVRQQIATARRAREVVEAQFVEAAQRGMPADSGRQAWQQAKVEYEEAIAQFQRVEAERRRLTESLEEVNTKLKTAEAQLHEKRESSLHFDWLKQTRSLLRSCHQALTQLLHDRAVPKDTAHALTQEIDQFLERTSDSMSVDLARSVLGQIEAPLQEVARLKAIMQERSAQLTSLPKPAPPSREKLDRAAAALRTRTPEAVSGPPSQANLAHARDRELAAEREGSAAAASLEQAHQELHELEQEILRERGSTFLKEVQEAEPSGSDATPSKDELQRLTARLAELGQIDPLVLKEYEEARQRWDHLTGQMNDIKETERNILRLKTELEHEIGTHFQRQFTVIAQAFGRYFEELFGGGRAALTASDQGVEIMVCPPGKRPRHITLLSGGEKALTSLALLLAIVEAGQPPFIIFDEVDAALDEANSERLARILQAKSGSTQCIIISHNRQTMAIASVLYGVTMQQDGISKVYSVKLSDIEEIERLEDLGEKMTV